MKKIINIYLASPRGFCAGVKRAIEIVELALQKYGPPIYVRHEIVHNKDVVKSSDLLIPPPEEEGLASFLENLYENNLTI